ncbi:hypothetical protein K439DRAFT_1350889 [Ramaria rubella]|nr:hypothetical protein K439DRAFT_1350889 [Ramaria rubella]
MLKQFDVPAKGANAALSQAKAELQEMAGELDIEELETRLTSTGGDGDDDDVNDFMDELAKMSPSEHKCHSESVRPVCLVLVKLRKITFKIVNSPTKLLPAWHGVLHELKLAVRMMPHDVSTWWNSTYDMLVFALEYQKALKAMTGDLDLGLETYELTVQEWRIAEQLCDILQVHHIVPL